MYTVLRSSVPGNLPAEWELVRSRLQAEGVLRVTLGTQVHMAGSEN